MASLQPEDDDFMSFLEEGASPSDIWPVVARNMWKRDTGVKS